MQNQNNEDELREFLLKHARHPKRVGQLIDADGTGHCHNPLCGDKITVTFMVKDQLLKNISILPSGCSISIASASLMTELVEGKSLVEVMDYITAVNENFTPSAIAHSWPELLKSLSPLKRIRENPLKIPCTLLCWFAIKKAVEDYQNKAGISI
jgi:nitrogen fixation NifU-like protein